MPTLIDSHGVMVCPLNQAAPLVPLVHPAKTDFVAHPERNSVSNVNIVSNQQRLPVPHVKHKPLVSRTIMVISQQSTHNTGSVDPLPGIVTDE